MPVAVEFLNAGRGVFSRASGHLDGAELVKAAAKINASHVEARPILYSFFDFDGITGLTLSATQIHEVADLGIAASRISNPGRVCAIHARNDLQFGLARMWQTFVAETAWETDVFRERAEAVGWVRKRVASIFGVQAELT